MWMCYFKIVIYLFIYLFIYVYLISNTSRLLTQVSIRKLENCSVQPLALPLSFRGHLEKDVSASVRFECVLLNHLPRTPVQ